MTFGLSDGDRRHGHRCIAGALYRGGFVETWGRSVEKVCRECEKFGVPRPEYTATESDVMACLHARSAKSVPSQGLSQGPSQMRQRARIAALRPFPKETLKSLRDYYRVGLTYSSNALEGNSLTESETKVVIEDGLTIGGKPLRDVYEATGHAKAYDFLYQLTKNAPVCEEDILKIHRLFYGQIDKDNAGKWRTVHVFISGSRRVLPSPDKLPELMSAFVKWMDANEGRLHPVEFAALVHLKFVYIHPFVDGNGRLARLLMNLALMRAGWTLAVIPPICRHEYIATSEKAGRQSAPFVRFIRDRVCETQKELLRLMGLSISIDDEGVNRGNDEGVNEGVNVLLDVIRMNPGKRANELAGLIGKSVQTVERYVKALKDSGRIEFRGAPKNGGYYCLD